MSTEYLVVKKLVVYLKRVGNLNLKLDLDLIHITMFVQPVGSISQLAANEYGIKLTYA